MITVLQRGMYKLLETKNETKILIFDEEKTFAWIHTDGIIGEILVTTHKPYKTDCLLTVGYYRLYNVKDEKKLSDQIHLELYVGQGIWQGYLLPTGFPTENKKRSRIIPTGELISVPIGEQVPQVFSGYEH